jgi:hypothetical protein
MKNLSLTATARIAGLVIAAVAVPALGGADDAADPCRRRLVDQVWLCSQSLASLRSVAICVQSYVIDNKALPGVSTLEELMALVEPAYIKTLPTIDAWGTPLRYVASPDGTSFRVISAGSDGQFDPPSWDRPGLLTSSKDDAVITGSYETRREWVLQE